MLDEKLLLMCVYACIKNERKKGEEEYKNNFKLLFMRT